LNDAPVVVDEEFNVLINVSTIEDDDESANKMYEYEVPIEVDEEYRVGINEADSDTIDEVIIDTDKGAIESVDLPPEISDPIVKSRGSFSHVINNYGTTCKFRGTYSTILPAKRTNEDALKRPAKPIPA
jgi:hypothetical protein